MFPLLIPLLLKPTSARCTWCVGVRYTSSRDPCRDAGRKFSRTAKHLLFLIFRRQKNAVMFSSLSVCLFPRLLKNYERISIKFLRGLGRAYPKERSIRFWWRESRVRSGFGDFKKDFWVNFWWSGASDFGIQITIRIQEFFNGFFIYYCDSYREPGIKHKTQSVFYEQIPHDRMVALTWVKHGIAYLPIFAFSVAKCTIQRWKWVIFRDPWPMWPIAQLTHDPHDPWPMTHDIISSYAWD